MVYYLQQFFPIDFNISSVSSGPFNKTRDTCFKFWRGRYFCSKCRSITSISTDENQLKIGVMLYKQHSRLGYFTTQSKHEINPIRIITRIFFSIVLSILFHKAFVQQYVQPEILIFFLLSI